MFSPFERMVALRYLRSRRQEGFISVIAWFSLLGIMLGVATLIIVMSVMNGFREELLGRILGFNGHVGVFGLMGGPVTEFDAVAARLRGQPHVRAAAPMIDAQALVTARGIASGAVVRAFRTEDLAKRGVLATSIRAGAIADVRGRDAAMIGRRMAERFGLRLGDPLTLVVPVLNETGMGAIPRSKSFEVAAIYEIGMYEYDNNFVFIPFEIAQILYEMRQGATGIDVLLDDPNNAVAVARDLDKALGGRFRVNDWQRVNRSFFNALQVERNVMFLILTLIIVVAAFNIISSLIMLVKDKGKDIAILRTMGATRGMILRIFLLCGASVGVVGAVAGLALGLAFAHNIEAIRQFLQTYVKTDLFAKEVYFLSKLPAVVNPAEVAMILAMALLLSFLATIYPAWRAARLDPVEALRYE